MVPSASGRPTKNQRLARVAEVERERNLRERRRSVMLWSLIAGLLIVVLGALAVGLRQQSSAQKAAAAGVKTYKVESDHVSKPVEYKQNPPVGGPHNPIWLNCGIYDKEVPSENAVHSMEHGAVWITYDPALSASDVEKLRERVPTEYGVLSPYPGLKDPVVVSAWGKQFRADGVDDPGLKAFVSEYTQGAQAPEPGASCSGGSDGTLPLDQAERS